ncbi:MAG: tyrosine--tRNA ligase [Candidatus Hydrogenedentota bacterium]
MSLYHELVWRRMVHQITSDELPAFLEKESFTVYAGFDPTADSLHVGHLLPVMGLVHCQRAGHRPIAVVGGATGMIGDPSGKSSERNLLDEQAIERNVNGLRGQLEKFLDFSGERGALLVNNHDWIGDLTLIRFLRDVGKHFSVNAMMAKDSVKNRIENREQGISFTEFTYSLLQAFDYYHLCATYGCRLQIGGSDQWGNIVAGTDLIRRLLRQEAYGLTFHLLEKSDGTKFGKTESGAVWLDPNRTSPYKFYQFWINTADSDVPRMLRTFTLLSHDETEALESAAVDAPEKREAQKKLAGEVTRMVHGDDALQNAIRASQAMFGGDIKGLDDATLLEIFDEVPSIELPAASLGEAKLLIDVLVETNVFPSKGEARRMIQNGGLYLNGERATLDSRVNEQALCSASIAVVRKGKKDYHLLKFVE